MDRLANHDGSCGLNRVRMSDSKRKCQSKSSSTNEYRDITVVGDVSFFIRAGHVCLYLYAVAGVHTIELARNYTCGILFVCTHFGLYSHGTLFHELEFRHMLSDARCNTRWLLCTSRERCALALTEGASNMPTETGSSTCKLTGTSTPFSPDARGSRC